MSLASIAAGAVPGFFVGGPLGAVIGGAAGAWLGGDSTTAPAAAPTPGMTSTAIPVDSAAPLTSSASPALAPMAPVSTDPGAIIMPATPTDTYAQGAIVPADSSPAAGTAVIGTIGGGFDPSMRPDGGESWQASGTIPGSVFGPAGSSISPVPAAPLPEQSSVVSADLGTDGGESWQQSGTAPPLYDQAPEGVVLPKLGIVRPTVPSGAGGPIARVAQPGIKLNGLRGLSYAGRGGSLGAYGDGTAAPDGMSAGGMWLSVVLWGTAAYIAARLTILRRN